MNHIQSGIGFASVAYAHLPSAPAGFAVRNEYFVRSTQHYPPTGSVRGANLNPRSHRRSADSNIGSGTVAMPIAASPMPYGSTSVSACTNPPHEYTTLGT